MDLVVPESRRETMSTSHIEEFQFRRGLVGEVRQILMKDLMRPKRFQDVAQNLNMERAYAPTEVARRK
jgi:hypothetical protein